MDRMKEVEGILKQAGYYEERSVDICGILQMYDEFGYHYNYEQKAFVKKFAFLQIHYIHPIWKQDMIIRLDPLEAQKTISMDVVEEYNEFLQDDLLIIGDIERENMTLFLSDKGFYFTGYDDCLVNWGSDFKEMLSKIALGNRGELQIID